MKMAFLIPAVLLEAMRLADSLSKWRKEFIILDLTLNRNGSDAPIRDSLTCIYGLSISFLKKLQQL